MKSEKERKQSFYFYLDLGEQKIAQLYIKEDSDPYVEASKLCAKHGLPTIIITILGDQIRREMEKQMQLNQVVNTEKRRKQRNHSLQREKNERDQPQTFQTEQKQEVIFLGQDKKKCGSIEPQMNSKQFDSKLNVFMNLYNNHKQLEMKKEWMRQCQLQSIPFRPKINNLSRKIVTEKRKMRFIDEEDVYLSSQKYKCINSSKEKGKVKVSQYLHGHQNLTRQGSTQSIYMRGQQFLKQSKEKVQKIKAIIDKKLMQNCSFHPRLTARWR